MPRSTRTNFATAPDGPMPASARRAKLAAELVAGDTIVADGCIDVVVGAVELDAPFAGRVAVSYSRPVIGVRNLAHGEVVIVRPAPRKPIVAL